MYPIFYLLKGDYMSPDQIPSLQRHIVKPVDCYPSLNSGASSSLCSRLSKLCSLLGPPLEYGLYLFRALKMASKFGPSSMQHLNDWYHHAARWGLSKFVCSPENLSTARNTEPVLSFLRRSSPRVRFRTQSLRTTFS